MNLYGPAPRSLNAVLSPTWLSQALELPVASAKIVETLSTVATKVRFTVEFEDGADGHRAYCVKGFFNEDPLPPGRALISQTETLFYREFSGAVGVNTPQCVYTGIDQQTGHGLIIMRDVIADGGLFLTALEPYTPEQAAASLEQLARLHAAHWDSSGLPSHPWLRSRIDDIAQSPLRTPDELQALMDGERGVPLADSIKNAATIHRSLVALAERLSRSTVCLVHGDAHSGNLFVQDGQTALIDWQLLQRSHWSIDVAYHIAAALAVDDRRDWERQLLRHYLDRLAAHGVQGPSENEAWSAYRAGMAYGYYLWTSTRQVTPMVIHEFCLRLGTAVTDLESFEILDAQPGRRGSSVA